MDRTRSAAYREVEDIPGAGYTRRQFVVMTTADGPSERRVGPEVWG